MMLLTKPSFYLAIVGIVGAILLVKNSSRESPAPPPFAEPARAPYAESLAASGLVEAVRENVKIAPPRPGLVQKVFVEVAQKVKAGDALLQLDDREARARIEAIRVQLGALRASIVVEEVLAADALDQLERMRKRITVEEVLVADALDQVERMRKLAKAAVATEEELRRREFALAKAEVTSKEELRRREFAHRVAEARVLKLKADQPVIESQIAQVQTEIDLLTVRAPRAATVLQINIRAGEYANVSAPEPLMMLGDVEKLQVRADVDEQNAPLFEVGQPAVAFLKGTTQNAMPLRFVRVEPFVVPKRSLTGDSLERVDTRVLQIIYELDRPAIPLYVGQQVDVFIQRTSRPKPSINEPANSVSTGTTNAVTGKKSP